MAPSSFPNGNGSHHGLRDGSKDGKGLPGGTVPTLTTDLTLDLTQAGLASLDFTRLGVGRGGNVVALEPLNGSAPGTPQPKACPPLGDSTPRLSRRGRVVVEVGSVLGGPFSVNDVADILGEPAGHLLPAVEEVIQSGMVVPTDDRLDFAEENVRHRIYEELPEPLRVSLHGHVGRRLLERGGSPAVAAQHLVLGTRPGDHQALECLDRATRELLPTSAPAAAALALGALALTDEGDARRWSRRIFAVDALGAAQRPGEALDLARGAIAEGDVPGLAAAQLRIRVAAHLLAQGLIAECVEELEVVLRTEGLPDSIYAAAELQIQLSLLAKESFAEARERALAVLAGNSRSSANAAMTGALITLAVLDWDEGRPTNAIGLARAAAERAERDPEISCTRVPKFLLGWMLTDIGKLDEARELIRASGELRRGLWPALLPLLNSHLRLASGQLEGAGAEAAKGLALVQGSHLGLFEPAARSVLAAVEFFQGNQRGAADLMDGVRSGVPRHSLFGLRLNAFPDLQLREASDGFPTAVDGLQEALAEPRGDVAVSQRLQLEDPTAAAWLVRGALATDNRAMAERVVRCAIELASENAGIPSIAAAANHARGLLEADVDLLLDAARSHSRPWARARAVEDAGITVSATGDTAGAQPHLEGALARYQELGAEHDVARVRSLLRTMGVRQCHWRRRERPVSGWESLTETERSVSDLVAQGLTNRGAAEQMFLSPHTIDFHLRQIFRKLQIDSRVDLTRMTIVRDAGAGAEAKL